MPIQNEEIEVWWLLDLLWSVLQIQEFACPEITSSRHTVYTGSRVSVASKLMPADATV